MDKNGYSYDTGDFSFNFDKSPFEEEERRSRSLGKVIDNKKKK